MSELKITDLPGGIVYIENAFPLHKEFLEDLESNEGNAEIQNIIPPWTPWIDGGPVKTIRKDGTVGWEQVLDLENGNRGHFKSVNWDTTKNGGNRMWPRIDVMPTYDAAHSVAWEILRKIDEPYRNLLNIWSEKTGNPFFANWITKNYTIRRYRTGGSIGPHVDKNIENPDNSMDWTALIYLNGDYEGGEIEFTDLGFKLKPSAGSILFFPCLETHSVKEVLSGTKTYIFLFIHLDVGISTAIGESYQELTKRIKSSSA